MTSVYAPQSQPVTPELLEEVHYQLALDASLQANNQPSMSAEVMQRLIHTGADSDYVPTYVESPAVQPPRTFSREEIRAVAHFFDAIIAGQVEAVQLLLNSGMDVECQDRLRRNMTPLYAAVRANQSRMMFLLINAGADVNRFSGDPDIKDPYITWTIKGDSTLKRTPLMRAAQDGRLRMVRDLVEQCKADPMAISADGQSAQRLAAKAGHRDVVKYLPINRGGIGKRIQYDYHTRYRRIRSLVETIYFVLKFFLWSIPKFFLWSTPKYVFTELRRSALHIYDVLPPVRTWPSLIWDAIVDLFKAIWRGTVRLVKGIPKFLKACYNDAKRLVKSIPGVTVRAAKAIGRSTRVIGRWAWNFMKGVGGAVLDISKAVANVFLTVYFYMESLIQRLRAVKFKDVVRAVQRVLHAILVAFPKALWRGLKTAVRFVDRTLKSLTLGVWWFMSRLAGFIVSAVLFIPEQILRILSITVQGIGKLFMELWLFINPRSMM